MVHNLYSFYVYIVFLALLIFAPIGLGLLLQPLHLYGAQFILLNLLIPAWILLFNQLVDAVAFGGKGSGVTPCGGFVACPQTNILSSAAATLWIVLFWLGYGYIARGDTA